MTQFRLIEPQQANDETRKQLEEVQNKIGKLPNIFKSMANAPAVLDAYLNFDGSLAKSSLSARLREQIALTTAEKNNCDYCLAAHSTIGKMLGLSDEEIENNRRATSSDDETKAALTFAGKLVDKRGAVSSDDIEEIRAAGFDDAKVSEIVATVVFNTFTNYFNLTAQTPIDFPKASPLIKEKVNN